MEKTIRIIEYFAGVETTEEHNGYYFSVGEALTIVILGTICGLRNVNQIQQWASNERVREFLLEHFGIKKIPCYYWLLCLLKLIVPKSFNQCFIMWVQSFLPDKAQGLTLSFDGKTIRSTGKMDKYESPLHIVSAHVAELGITFGQQTVDGKSNEIPAMRELLGLLEIKGHMVVADALNCQRDTAKAIVAGKADYLLNVKDNQPNLKEEIEEYIQNDDLRKTMDTYTSEEKKSGRIEKRIAYATCAIDWFSDKKEEWEKLACIGAVNTRFTTQKGTTNEWHYYISSRKLSAEDLLKHARLEWSVETMHWLLDVHFGEDFCRIEDRNVQQNLNMVRKVALNCIKEYKEKIGSKFPISKIMLNCLIDYKNMLPILTHNEN
jgi:predicted transposase YbfD/YdcC